MMDGVNWLLALTAAILITAAVVGYIRGLIKTVVNLVIGVVTLILVLIFSPKVCDYLQQTNLPEYISAKVESAVWEKVEQMRNEGQEIALDEGGRDSFIEELPFVPILKNALQNNELLEQYAGDGLDSLVAYIGNSIAAKIVMLIGYAATFVIVFFLLRVAVFLLNILEHLPLIHGLNKLTGLAAGLLEGLMLVWLLGIGLTALNATALGQSAAECIRDSRLLAALYGNNLLERIVFWSIGM